MAELVGSRYERLEKIGEGGMGAVYRGVDTRTRLPVAIKQLDADVSSPELIERFKREGEALRQLNHPNIVKMLDTVYVDGEYYLIMELVEGGTLEEQIKHNAPLPLQQILNVALDLADALTRAHRLNIIHRDIKPPNVLLAIDGTPRLTDFGIARFSDSKITETGLAIGTLNYIAPEILRGQEARIASDIWSMGVTLYELLSGQSPFTAPNIGALMFNIMEALPPELELLRPDAPLALIDLINRMMMKDPAERIPSMRLVGAELEAILAGQRQSVPASVQSVLPEGEAGRRFATSSVVAGQRVRNNLPAQTSPFVGREHELAEVETLLREPSTRLLTILAPGGMGKTRLALELGTRMLNVTRSRRLFEEGIYFIDLAPLSSPETMIQAVADSLSYQIQQDGREAKHQILDFLREKRALLIMDNFEHVIAGRTLAQDILQAAQSVKILATSRERLALSTETVFGLDGMEITDWKTPEEAFSYGAVKLFMQSTHRVRPDFQLQADDLRNVAAICSKVQGAPLGIVLAATWIESLALQEIVEEIDRSTDFLETTMHDIPERQRSMRAVFEYSWQLLTEQERDLLPRFFMFRGGFTREAAQEVTGANLRILNTLMTKSLLRRDNVSGRYEIHELLRQYLEEKARQSNIADISCDAHSRYYGRLVTQLTPRLKGTGQLDALEAMEIDFENIRVAWLWMVAHKDSDGVVVAIEGIYLFLTFRNRYMDAQQLFGKARVAWPVSSDNAGALALAGRLLVRFPESEALLAFQRGLAIAEQQADSFEIAFCQRLGGYLLSHTLYNQDEGIPRLEAAVSGFRLLNQDYYVALSLDDLSWSEFLNARLDRQAMYAQESLAIRRKLGDRIGTANALRNLSNSFGGFYDGSGRALIYWQEAKTIAYEMNDRSGIVWNTILSAGNLMLVGKFEQAQTQIDEASPHAQDLNDPVTRSIVTSAKGFMMALRDENYNGAWALFDEANRQGGEAPFRFAIVTLGMGVVACGLDDPCILAPYWDDLLKSPFTDDIFYIMPILAPCAIYVLNRANQYEQAVELLGAYVNGNFNFQGIPTAIKWGLHWKVFSQLQQALEQRLGTDEFQRMIQQGIQRDPRTLAVEVRQFFASAVHCKA